VDVSELRKRILHALDDARKEAAAKRGVVDEAGRAYEAFLVNIAVPMFKQAQAVLKETTDRLAAVAAERQRVLAAELSQQIDAAERQIAATKEQALAEVRGIAIDVGRSVVEKLTGTAPDAARLSAAVDTRLAAQAR